ncbi:MAG: hypothetical protein GY822_18230 [Deltaproteobacteria bacterium]|nr:hypothetical protein [Deltaproteobacteria bacterium]
MPDGSHSKKQRAPADSKQDRNRRMLLDSNVYFDFLALTHPELQISTTRLPVPSFIAPLDTREPLLQGPMRSLLSAVKKVMPGPVTPPSLFLGSPFERYCQHALLDTVDDLSALKRICVDVAKKESLDLVVVTNLRATEDITPWLDEGFVALPSFPDTVIDLDVASFDEHLMRLPQGNRSGIRRNIRKFEKQGHRLRRLAPHEKLGKNLYETYRPYFDDATVQWFPHNDAYFDGLAAIDDDVFVTIAESSTSHLLGFIVNFLDGTSFQSGRIGVHRDFHKEDAVYFRLIYHVVEEAIAKGSGTLSLEPTGYRMKRHLGARVIPQVNLCLGVSPLWRTLLSSFSGVGKKLLSHLEEPEVLEKNY